MYSCATVLGPSVPAFEGNDYYCESGDVERFRLDPYYLDDLLWDGSGCGDSNICCAQIGMPWFYRKLPMTTIEDVKIRICKNFLHAVMKI